MMHFNLYRRERGSF